MSPTHHRQLIKCCVSLYTPPPTILHKRYCRQKVSNSFNIRLFLNCRNLKEQLTLCPLWAWYHWLSLHFHLQSPSKALGQATLINKVPLIWDSTALHTLHSPPLTKKKRWVSSLPPQPLIKLTTWVYSQMAPWPIWMDRTRPPGWWVAACLHMGLRQTLCCVQAVSAGPATTMPATQDKWFHSASQVLSFCFCY